MPGLRHFTARAPGTHRQTNMLRATLAALLAHSVVGQALTSSDFDTSVSTLDAATTEVIIGSDLVDPLFWTRRTSVDYDPITVHVGDKLIFKYSAGTPARSTSYRVPKTRAGAGLPVEPEIPGVRRPRAPAITRLTFALRPSAQRVPCGERGIVELVHYRRRRAVGRLQPGRQPGADDQRLLIGVRLHRALRGRANQPGRRVHLLPTALLFRISHLSKPAAPPFWRPYPPEASRRPPPRPGPTSPAPPQPHPHPDTLLQPPPPWTRQANGSRSRSRPLLRRLRRRHRRCRHLFSTRL